MRLLRSLQGLAAVLLAAALQGQAGGRLPFVLLGREQGLPSGSVACLDQDAEGFLWLGSESGLVRHAAGQWRVWTSRDGLPSDFVPQLVAAPDGLWVASLRGLARFRDGRVALATVDGQPLEGGVGRLARDREGRLLATLGKRIYRQTDGLAFEALPWSAPSPPFALAAGPATGAIYIGHRGGLHARFPGGREMDWTAADGLPVEGPSIVIEDGQGRLWAGSGRTLVVKAPDAPRFTDASALLPGSLTPNSLPYLDRDGSAWLPTQAGLVHLTARGAERLGPAEGLPFRWARAVFRDAEGSLWVAGPSLAQLKGGGRVWNYGSGDGGEAVVWWLARDRQGRLLVGSDDGAARLGPEGLARVPGTEGRRIKSLLEDRGGRLWMVSTTGPALWLDPGAARARVAPLGEAGAFVNCVAEDAAGQVWLGHSSLGLLRWDPAARRLVQEVPPARFGLQALGVFSVDQDRRGRIWAGTTAGLVVRETDGAWHLFTSKEGLGPHNLRGVAFLPDGSAWVQYQEPQGLTRVRVEGGRLEVLQQLRKGSGLRTDLVYAVASDPGGRVWISTDHGLDRLDRPAHVGVEQGMANEDGSVHALLLEPGKVWAGTAAGFVRVDETEAPAAPAPPRVMLLALELGGRVLEPPFHLAPVPHGDATVGFRVGAPSFLDEQGLRIQVRLRGLETGWHDLDGHLARYAALPGGDYVFEARAAQGDGPFGPACALPFTVKPPWWLSWWALAAWTAAAAAAVLGLFRIRLAALARSKAALEATVARRTEELQARNEDLSAALTKVKQLSGLLPICASCKKIRDDGGYWNQLETYISQHSEADFTHGICPECARALYEEAGLPPPGFRKPPADPS